MTELILDNTFATFEPEEIVALLSAFVFQEKVEIEPVLTEKLEEVLLTHSLSDERANLTCANFLVVVGPSDHRRHCCTRQGRPIQASSRRIRIERIFDVAQVQSRRSRVRMGQRNFVCSIDAARFGICFPQQQRHRRSRTTTNGGRSRGTGRNDRQDHHEARRNVSRSQGRCSNRRQQRLV